MPEKYIQILPEIATAIAESKPVIALESTIICHGMPFPKNVETALRVEQEVRKNGAIPATIAIIDGIMRVGLTEKDINHLGKKGVAVTKVSRRDLPFIIAQKKDGATTVAATMMIAHMAGIQLFATGGIGGVHRGASQTFDISADLQELAHTPVAVVCAGVKSILDLGLTLEYLETYGVPVIGYQTNELPAFYTRKSGHALYYKLDSPKEIADTLNVKRWVSKGGTVIANPIPQEFEMPKAKIDKAIESALKKAEEKGITGKSITPFLLSEIEKITKGNSLASNIQLVLNNAALAAQIAVQMCK